MEKVENEDSSATETYMQFFLGDERYAIHLLDVREVIPKPETTKIPKSPSYFLGIIDLRGLVISILDLRKMLSIDASQQDIHEETVIIVSIQGLSVGLTVDSINKVVSIPQSDWMESPEVDARLKSSYFSGICNLEERLTVLLNMEKVLDLPKIKQVSENAA